MLRGHHQKCGTDAAEQRAADRRMRCAKSNRGQQKVINLQAYLTCAVSYTGIMKQQTRPPTAELEKKFVYNHSMWIDVKGKEIGEKNHYVKEQGEKVCEIIRTALLKIGSISELYIISPFTSVVSGIRTELRKALGDFEENTEHFITNNIGTVHKFQGKEANEVIFVLGCDETAVGAVQWVNSNIVNVAATRTKYKLYIIGDRSENVRQKKILKIVMSVSDKICD